MQVNRKASDVALAAPASSNSLFKGDRQSNLRQAGGARSGRGGDRRPDEDKLKRLGLQQWIGIIGVHSHLFDNQCKGCQRRWRTLVAAAFGLPTRQQRKRMWAPTKAWLVAHVLAWTVLSSTVHSADDGITAQLAGSGSDSSSLVLQWAGWCELLHFVPVTLLAVARSQGGGDVYAFARSNVTRDELCTQASGDATATALELCMVCRVGQARFGRVLICPEQVPAGSYELEIHAVPRSDWVGAHGAAVLASLKVPLLVHSEFVACASSLSRMDVPRQIVGRSQDLPARLQALSKSVVCLDTSEEEFLRRLPSIELVHLLNLTCPDHALSCTSCATTRRNKSIQQMTCLPPADMSVLRVALAELGHLERQDAAAMMRHSGATVYAHEVPCHSQTRRDHLLQQQLVSDGTRSCSPKALMEAVGNGYRDRAGGPFHMDGCQIKWYSADDACEVLQHRVGRLHLVGDSIMRHLMQALLTVLSGEYEIATSAGTRASDSAFRSCDCDAAYDDLGGDALRYCRMHSIAWASDLRMLREALPG